MCVREIRTNRSGDSLKTLQSAPHRMVFHLACVHIYICIFLQHIFVFFLVYVCIYLYIFPILAAWFSISPACVGICECMRTHLCVCVRVEERDKRKRKKQRRREGRGVKEKEQEQERAREREREDRAREREGKRGSECVRECVCAFVCERE